MSSVMNGSATPGADTEEWMEVTAITVRVGELLIECRRSDGATVTADLSLTPDAWAQTRALAGENGATLILGKRLQLQISAGNWPKFREAFDLAFGLPKTPPRTIEFERDANGRPIRATIQ